MEKRIVLAKGDSLEWYMSTLNIESKKMVSQALNYHVNSERAKAVRALAIQRGAQIIPAMSTDFKDGKMIQRWGVLATIVFDRATGETQVEVKGKKPYTLKEDSIEALMREQRSIERWIAFNL